MRENRRKKKRGFAGEAVGLYANYAEKEKIKGHHSPEGIAIRTLIRALNGWSRGNLSGKDTIILSQQGIEDWLKARLKLPAWSQKELSSLLGDALRQGLIAESEERNLQKLRDLYVSCRKKNGTIKDQSIFAALRDCLFFLERRW